MIRIIFLVTMFSSLFSFAALNVIPLPNSITPGTGQVDVSAGHILYADAGLKETAIVMSQAMYRIHGVKVATIASTNASDGDILLKYSVLPNITGSVHKISVDNAVIVEAQTDIGVKYGSITVIQAIENGSIDKFTIIDWPATNFRSVMIDIARQWHEISEIKQVIDLCQMYKMPYLHLHLSDNESFTFPSTRYPALQGPGTRYYTLTQWKDMVSYAGHRGVALIPEMDVPGHARRLCQAEPSLFGRLSENTIGFGNPSVWAGISNIITEFCEVFTNSPYIHLGGDEVWGGDPVFDTSDPTNAATIANYDLGDMTGVFNFFFNTMNNYINNKGKQLILWEGFHNSHYKCPVETDIQVMMFDNYKNAQTYYIDSGYRPINTSWFPLYVLNWAAPLESIYAWDLYTFGNYTDPYPRRYTSVTQYKVTTESMVPGGGMCSWEQPGEVEVPSLRKPMATMSERLWNRASTATFTDFTNRLEKTDAQIQAMMATGVPSLVVPSASFNVYEDKILVRWLPADGYPTKYTLLRNTSNNTSGATELLVDSTANIYVDTEASLGQTYYYWVKAGNDYGYTSTSSSADGRRGNSVQLPYAYESFDYNPGGSISGKNGGIGFGTSWSSEEGSATSSIKNDNLTYPGLYTSGKCVHFEANGSTEPQRSYFQRQTLATQGIEGSDLWTSCLIRPTNVGDGDFRYYVGLGVPVCKRWGNGMYLDGGFYAPLQLENDQTYFIVVKFECGNGPGRGYMWVNPVAGVNEPSLKDPSVSYSEGKTFNTGKDIGFTMQYHGDNTYDIDEMRVGSSWAEVCPLTTPPTGSVYNTAYEAFDGTTGTTVIGTSGGSHWAGNWYDAQGGLNNADAVFSSEGLSYLDSLDWELVSEGKALKFDPQTMGSPSYMILARLLPRIFGKEAGDSELYFSYLVKPELENTNLDYYFGLGNDFKMIVRGWRTTWEINGGVSTITKPVEGETQFILGKITLDTTMSYDLWLNPDLRNVGDPDYSSSRDFIIFDKVLFAQQTPAGFTKQINLFDEFRIGTNLVQVLPSIPEPGLAFGLLPLILIAISKFK